MTERRFRTLAIVLLVLNIFLIGALAGGILWLRNGQPPAGRTLQIAGRQLPEAGRTAFQEVLRKARRASRDIIQSADTAREDAARILSQPVLDKTALMLALERTRNADLALRARIEEKAVDFAASLSIEDRGLLADGLSPRRKSDPAPAPP